jgi:hypothetical protein
VIRQLPAGIISREPLTHAHSQDVVEPGVALGSSFEHRRDTEIAHLRGEPLDERWHVAAKDQDGQAEEGSLSMRLDCPPDRFAAIATHSSGQLATRLAPVKSVLNQYGPPGSPGC